MTLQEFIEKCGDEKAAELFGVRVRTAASWRRGERYPRVEQAQAIVIATNGEVSMDGIFGATSSPKAEAAHEHLSETAL